MLVPEHRQLLAELSGWHSEPARQTALLRWGQLPSIRSVAAAGFVVELDEARCVAELDIALCSAEPGSLWTHPWTSACLVVGEGCS